MYYCYNCRNEFEKEICTTSPFPDYGCEPIALCPLCGAPEYFRKLPEQEEERP